MLTTFVIVCLLLGSVVLAIKAVVMNSLSIVGSFGAMVFLFQEGHLGLVDGPSPLEPTLPVLLFCILFGLSMDYELLILNRVKEVWSRTKDNVRAVGEGLEKTAGVVTSAAAIMIAVFLSFGLSHVVVIKAVGVGMGVAVALDATLVRILLVPGHDAPARARQLVGAQVAPRPPGHAGARAQGRGAAVDGAEGPGRGASADGGDAARLSPRGVGDEYQ